MALRPSRTLITNASASVRAAGVPAATRRRLEYQGRQQALDSARTLDAEPQVSRAFRARDGADADEVDRLYGQLTDDPVVREVVRKLLRSPVEDPNLNRIAQTCPFPLLPRYLRKRDGLENFAEAVHYAVVERRRVGAELIQKVARLTADKTRQVVGPRLEGVRAVLRQSGPVPDRAIAFDSNRFVGGILLPGATTRGRRLGPDHIFGWCRADVELREVVLPDSGVRVAMSGDLVPHTSIEVKGVTNVLEGVSQHQQLPYRLRHKYVQVGNTYWRVDVDPRRIKRILVAPPGDGKRWHRAVTAMHEIDAPTYAIALPNDVETAILGYGRWVADQTVALVERHLRR